MTSRGERPIRGFIPSLNASAAPIHGARRDTPYGIVAWAPKGEQLPHPPPLPHDASEEAVLGNLFLFPSFLSYFLFLFPFPSPRERRLPNSNKRLPPPNQSPLGCAPPLKLLSERHATRKGRFCIFFSPPLLLSLPGNKVGATN